ncbi:conditioned medium-induced protein 4 [Halonotius terrestris]|uniref:Conditioned medium-induced protein 4 n=1 Tax=Halonotius terrestris TaxID=2487750 RepID=A0A8J8P9S8_9EURY|nr:conditioned medium-induced protein 4 [Halonotius terrestris]TQQ82859.1 conditioned medium-induced protein 4 [Halonotius terrestris]
MDEKTEELRDIFMEATESDTVTETQAESPGSLTDTPDDVTDRLATLLDRMRERYDFETGLDTDSRIRLLRGFYGDEDDETIADALDCEPETVRAARLDLHLVRKQERDAPFEFDHLRQLLAEEVPLEERADRLDADLDTVRRYSEVAAADRRSTRANNRFRDEFAELLTDAELTDQLAADTREDGLKEATEDIETDVSF